MGKATLDKLLTLPYPTIKERMYDWNLYNNFNDIYVKWIRKGFGHDNFMTVADNISPEIKNNPNIPYKCKLRVLDGSLYNYSHLKKVVKYVKEVYK